MLTLLLVLIICSWVGAVALLLTLWSMSISLARWVLGRSGVVSTWSKEVWLARRIVSIEVSRDEPTIAEGSPSWTGVTTIATISTSETARSNVLGGDSGLVLLVRSNEGPARSTVGLVSDLLDGLTSWPGISRIESVWSIDAIHIGVNTDIWGNLALWEWDVTHQLLDGVLVHIDESAWLVGSPRGVHGVNLFGNIGDSLLVSVVDLSEVISSKGGDGKHGDECDVESFHY
jgi:hypothetical protein